VTIQWPGKRFRYHEWDDKYKEVAKKLRSGHAEARKVLGNAVAQHKTVWEYEDDENKVQALRKYRLAIEEAQSDKKYYYDEAKDNIKQAKDEIDARPDEIDAQASENLLIHLKP